ncbi:hypothetical protein [Antarctobacter sp.]|uniref:hypothetical protein n=1 Tax=Antarctobacter sp. TaxID=1872577 RepID=UPI003A8DB54D
MPGILWVGALLACLLSLDQFALDFRTARWTCCTARSTRRRCRGQGAGIGSPRGCLW